MVITGPSGSGCHSVVWLLAAVPMLAILRDLRTRAGADVDRIAGRHAGRAPDVDGGIARARGSRQPGVGEAEQVEAVSRELRSGRDLHRREDGLLGRVLGQASSWRCRRAGAGVVELDERVRRVRRRTGADAELVDLDRADVPHFLGRRLGLLPAAGRVRPRGVADQVAVEGCRPRGDLEGRAHARTRRDRVSKRLRRLRGARNDGGPLLAGHGNAQLDVRRGRPRGVGERHGGVLRGPR